MREIGGRGDLNSRVEYLGTSAERCLAGLTGVGWLLRQDWGALRVFFDHLRSLSVCPS